MSKNKVRKRDTYTSYIVKSFIKKINIFKKKTVAVEDNLPRSPYGSAKDAPMHIAFIVDGVVEDIVHCEERFGYLLISSPTIVKLENYDSAAVNDVYDEEANIFKKMDEK